MQPAAAARSLGRVGRSGTNGAAVSSPSCSGAIADSYLLGPSLWVAPVLEEGATERRAYLPRGEWIDWWTEERLTGGRWIDAEAPLERIPLWVRAGSLLITYPAGEIAGGGSAGCQRRLAIDRRLSDSGTDHAAGPWDSRATAARSRPELDDFYQHRPGAGGRNRYRSEQSPDL